MNDFLKKLKSFYGFVASASVLIPGLTFFLNYSPPLIGSVSILVSALSAAFVWFGFKSDQSKSDGKVALQFMLIGFLLSISYWVFLDLTSIRLETNDKTIRYQVGFNLATWGLEHDALVKIDSKTCPSDSKENLFLCYTASEENVYLIWKRWTVYLFGVINIILFTTASLLWSYGWGKFITTDNKAIASTKLTTQARRKRV